MRLIDADALEMNVQNEWERNEISNGDWIQFREWLKEMPTIDAVPVVRCKDCVYWASGANEDESWEYCYWFESEIDGNEFCSYGERKDGDA